MDIDGDKFTDICFKAGAPAEMTDDAELISLSYTEDDLLFEESLTVSDLLTAEVELDDTLLLADGRVVTFFTEEKLKLNDN